jgi:tRNA (cytidine56-2'-O)-methyltransferase
MQIKILRLGHRPERDKRISTHCGLAARALGASGIIYSGEPDSQLIESVRHVAAEWGGKFSVNYEAAWRRTISDHKKAGWKIVHLTMYGLPIQKKRAELKRARKILIVVGGEKVPAEVYRMADYNIAVTGQPHSEVAALAIVLHELQKGRELLRKFPGAKRLIVPQACGKKVIGK